MHEILSVSKVLLKLYGEMAIFTEPAPWPIQSLSCDVHMFVPTPCNLVAALTVRDIANGHNNY